MKSIRKIAIGLTSLLFLESVCFGAEIGAGFDTIDAVGGHVNVELGPEMPKDSVQRFRFGLELGSRGYRHSDNTVSMRQSIEGQLYAKAIQPFASNISLFERGGFGYAKMPKPTDSSTVAFSDFLIGLRIEGTGAYVEFGSGVRLLDISRPVHVGVEVIDRNVLPISSITMGWTL